MRPRVTLEGIKHVRVTDLLVRFLFGGAISVATYLVGHHYGSSIGGVVLAFPAILPASLTLIRDKDGCVKAADDARGARLGAIGLVAFGAIVAVLATRAAPSVTLIAALVAWIVVSCFLWWLRYRNE